MAEVPPFLSGQLLLAMPGIGDPRFERAVIAMCTHDENGAFGIGVGHVVPGLGVHKLLEQFKIEPGVLEDGPVHFGGPVEPQRGFVLHGEDWGGTDTLHVGKGWALTSTIDVLRALAEGRGPAQWLVALGYAGWGEGQLEGELTRHGWFAAAASETILFDQPAEARWAAAFAGAGVDARLLTPHSGRA